MRIHYNPKLKALARRLRNSGTISERLLWSHLKGRRMRGRDFHRQKPVDEYIVDFFCPRLQLIIEIDGESHAAKGESDMERQERLRDLGFHVLRFDDFDLKNNMEGVLVVIDRWIEEHTLPAAGRPASNSPLKRGVDSPQAKPGCVTG